MADMELSINGHVESTVAVEDGGLDAGATEALVKETFVDLLSYEGIGPIDANDVKVVAWFDMSYTAPNGDVYRLQD